MSRRRAAQLALFLYIVVLVLAGCGEVDQQQSVQVSPEGGSRIAPLTAAEARRAREALADMPKPPAGWENAIVLEENSKGEDWARVLTRRGVFVLADFYSDVELASLVAPGDAIRYATKGDDFEVKADSEVVVVDIAVTEAP